MARTFNPDYQLHRNSVELILSHLDETPAVRHDMRELADRAGFPLKRFQEIFLDATGYAVADYLRCVRAEVAALMLSRCHYLSVPDIAVETGFDSVKTFMRAFQTHFGMSPEEWRDGEFWWYNGRYWDWRHAQERRQIQALGQGRVAGDHGMYYVDHAMADAADGRRPACIMNIEVRRLPPMRVAYMYIFGALTKSRWHSVRQCLKRWGARHGIIGDDTDMVVRCRSNPTVTPPDRLHYEIGLVIDPTMPITPEVRIHDYPADQYLIADFEGPAGDANLMWEYLCQYYLGRQPLRQRPGWKYSRVPLAQTAMPWVPDTQRIIPSASNEIVRYQEYLPIDYIGAAAA